MYKQNCTFKATAYILHVGIQFVPFFLGHAPVLGVLKCFVPMSFKILVGMPNVQGFFSRSKNLILLTRHLNIFDFPREGENLYRSRASLNQPLTGMNRRGRGREGWVDYRVSTKTAEKEEIMCITKSVHELDEFYYYSQYYCFIFCISMPLIVI